MPLTLLLLRHAKSDWSENISTDHERPLSDRGVRNAMTIANYLESKRLKPDRILCSTALRTRQTADAVLSIWPEIDIKYHKQLYLASTQDALYLLRQQDPAQRVLMVGHNPSTEDFLRMLVDSSLPQHKSLKDAYAKYPTGGLSQLAFTAADWSSLKTSSAQLIRFVKPKNLERDEETQ
ncbi:MAG: histidine phosphatase family protein [Rhodospirillaceae bacterium]